MYLRKTKARSYSRSTNSTSTQPKKDEVELPKFHEYIRRRDYSGSVAILETIIETSPDVNYYLTQRTDEDDYVSWLAYSYFHIGRFEDALNVYKKMMENRSDNGILVSISCCLFHLKKYEEAEKSARQSPEGQHKKRLLLALEHFRNNRGIKMEGDDEIKKKTPSDKSAEGEKSESGTLDPSKFDERDVIDQCCLAAIHYHRREFEQAIEIYKKILLTNKNYCALHVYIALCYYQIGYNDISEDIVNVYLKKHPKSIIGQNLRACNLYSSVDGESAEESLMKFTQQHCSSYELESLTIRHNLCIFRAGDQALKVFPELLEVFPVVLTNLVIFYLRIGEIGKAKELLETQVTKNLNSKSLGIDYYLLKAVIHTYLGQSSSSVFSSDKPSSIPTIGNIMQKKKNSSSLAGNVELTRAMEEYKRIGYSESEVDTVKGRQSMASLYFLSRSFEDVIIYLKSIEDFFQDSDEFLWNYGIANCECRLFSDALECLKKIRRADLKNDFLYKCYLGRCHVMTGAPEVAWDIYLKIEKDSMVRQYLLMLANDCYRMGHFFYAAKAFAVLEKMEPCDLYWKGKRGAICGLFQQIVAGKEERKRIKDVLVLLSQSSRFGLGSENVGRNYKEEQMEQVEEMKRVIKAWAILAE